MKALLLTTSIVILTSLGLTGCGKKRHSSPINENTNPYDYSRFGLSESTVKWNDLDLGTIESQILPGSHASMGADSSGGRLAGKAVVIQFPVTNQTINQDEFRTTFEMINSSADNDLVTHVFLYVWKTSINICVDYSTHQAAMNMMDGLSQIKDLELRFRGSSYCKKVI